MEHSFAHLLRSSKFAAFDPKVKQVWNTWGIRKAHGDWGFKRTVNAAKVAHHQVTLETMDHLYGYTHFDYAEQKVKDAQRFVQNFGNTPQPKIPGHEERKVADTKKSDEATAETGDGTTTMPRNEKAKPRDSPVAVDNLSPKEWRSYLAGLKKRRSELRKEWIEANGGEDLLSRKNVPKTEYLEFLNTTLAHPNAEALDSENTSYSAISSSSSNPASAKPRHYAGPTYSHPQPKIHRRVMGRVLNPTENSHSGPRSFVIGVAGATATLSDNMAALERMKNVDGIVDRGLQPFFVTHADTDAAGRPIVKLSLGRNTFGGRHSLSQNVEKSQFASLLASRGPLGRSKS